MKNNSTARVTKPGRTIFGGKSDGKHGSPKGGPRDIGIRSTVKPHAIAAKVHATKAALNTYPRMGAGIATAGVTSKTFAR